MENQIHSEDIFEVAIDGTSKNLIRDIALWAKIVAITAFISYGISLLAAVVGKNDVAGGELPMGLSRVSQIIGALLVAIIGVSINIYLYKFSVETKNALDGVNQEQLESGFNSLRIYFKILGIIFIIFIVLFFLAFLVAILSKSFTGGV
ncbi:MAG: DUF5362 family protein [Chitinophagaceae bacterium]